MGGIQTAKRLHEDYENALDDDKKNPFDNQPTNKVKLWDSLNKVLRAYREDNDKDASELYSYLDVQYSGESQDELLFGQSEMSLEDYMEVKVTNPSKDFVEFGKLVVSYRAQTELAAKKLVGYMKFGTDVVTADGVEAPSKSKLWSAVKEENAFVQDLASRPYVEQVEWLSTLTKRLSETNVGKRFLAEQFAYRDWDDDKDTSAVVFDPYKLFFPPEKSEKPETIRYGGLNPDHEPPSAGYYGVAILLSGSDQRGEDGRYDGIPIRSDLFDEQTGQFKGPAGGHDFPSQAKSLRTHFGTLFANLTPGVTFLDQQSGSGDAVFTSYPGSDNMPAENVQRWQGLMWAKFYQHDTEGDLPEIDAHTSQLGKLATGGPSSPASLPDWASIWLKLVKTGISINDKYMSNTTMGGSSAGGSGSSRLAGFGIIKLGLVQLSYVGIWSKIYNDDNLDYSEYADLLVDITKYIGDLSVTDDIVKNFELASQSDSGAAKVVDTAAKVGPFIDAYYLFNDSQQVVTEMNQDDVDAAVGMSMQVAGGATMLAGEVAAGGGALSAIMGATPAGWIILAGGALTLGGVAVYQFCNDSEMQNYFGHTCFGSYWEPDHDTKYEKPWLKQFRFVDDEGNPNYARQLSELLTITRSLVPTKAEVTYRDDRFRSPALKLEFKPIDKYSSTIEKFWASTLTLPGLLRSGWGNWSAYSSLIEKKLAADGIEADGYVFVRPIRYSNLEGGGVTHEFNPVIHQLQLDERWDYDIASQQTTPRSTGGSQDTEIPVDYADKSAYADLMPNRYNFDAETWFTGAASNPGAGDLDFETFQSVAGKPGGSGRDSQLQKVIKTYEATISGPEDKPQLLAGTSMDVIEEEASQQIIDPESTERTYYVELIYLPKDLYDRVKGKSILDDGGSHNDYDRLEDLPFVSRERRVVEFGTRTKTWTKL